MSNIAIKKYYFVTIMLFLQPAIAGAVSELDLSTPQKAHETCMSKAQQNGIVDSVECLSDNGKFKLVLGYFFLSGFIVAGREFSEDEEANKRATKVEEILERYNIKQLFKSKEDAKKNIAKFDIQGFISEINKYLVKKESKETVSSRTLTNVAISGGKAEGVESYVENNGEVKKHTMKFINVNGQWLLDDWNEVTETKPNK